jgi:glycosyltransferase involved in cell wall biosynthesis
MIKVDFSIIICCFNSEHRIIPTLNAIEKIDYPKDKFEVIFIDNKSTDKTTLVISSKMKSLKIGYVLLYEKKPGLSHARKLGIENARGKYFVFCDDDNLLFPDYLTVSREILDANDKIGLVVGENIAKSSIHFPDWFEAEKELFACGKMQENTVNVKNKSGLWGAGMVGRTKIMNSFYKLGFRHLTGDRVGKNLTGGGDIEISKWHVLVGFELWFCKDLKLYHIMPPNRLTLSYLSSLKEGISFSANKMWHDYNLIDKALKLRNRKKNLIRVFLLNYQGEIVRLKYGLCLFNRSLQSTYNAYRKVQNLDDENIRALFLVGY